MERHAPDLTRLKTSLLKRAAQSSRPSEEDEIIRTIYATPEIRGDIVLAGKRTRDLHPITDFPEYRVHFKKTNLGDPELNCQDEYRRHLQLYESWKSKQNTSETPIPIPRPLAYGRTTFRSELVFGITVGAASPCKIEKGSPPKNLEEWVKVLSPLKLISLDWQKKYWRGLEQLSQVIYRMQGLNHVAHKDLHKENMMLVPTQAGYRPALIDFETAKFDPEKQERQSDYLHLIHEARLVLAGPLKAEPEIQRSQLAEIALQNGHRIFSRYDLACLEKAEKFLQTIEAEKEGPEKKGRTRSISI